MSNLTRIKNNQITDSTIFANTKIYPGSIVGSLFNTNLTMTSDVTITGNLTVQGSSTYLTVASTNTYVNDPLIILNNAFSGTNTYDIGLLFNRGDQTTASLTYNEANDEFRLGFTSNNSTVYGAIVNDSYANVRLGNLVTVYDASVRNLTASGNVNVTSGISVTGDLAVNGGDLTTSQTTFNLVNATATTVNFAGAATSIVAGATTGTFNLRNANLYLPNATTIYSGQTTLSIANEVPTTLNIGGAATTLTLGGTSGTASLRNANIWLPNATTLGGAQATVGLFNLATTVDAFKAATDLEFGATTGTLTINNPTVVGTQTTQALFNTTATTVNAFGAATALNIGANTGTLTLRNPTVVGTETTQNLYNTTATTVNFAGAATLLTVGATSGNTQIRNNLDVALSLDARDIQNTVIGNVSPAAATFTTLTAQGTTQLGLTSATAINSTPIGNATPSTGAFTTLSSSGTTQLNLTTAVAINSTPIGNATASSGRFTTLVSTSTANLGALTAASINGTVIGNVTPAAATVTTLTTQGTTSLSLTTATAINNTPIGNATPSTGAFTTLTASGITTVTNSTAATSVGTGAFQVTGGASVGGNLYVGGNINIVGSSFVLTGNAGVFYGDINGFGALYAGVTGYTPLPATVLQTAGSFNGYVQNNFENLSTGAKASTDWVATAGDGSDVNHYIDMGITTVNWDGTQDNSLTNALGGNDGYMYVQGNIASGQGGNLVIGASTPGTKKVSVIVGGNTASNITAVFRNPGTAASDTTTGALTVIGGVGILGNIYANNLNTSGSISTADLTLTGDLGVNGGDITTTASTFNLLASNATTVNAFGAATTLNLASATGNTIVRNRLVANATTPSTSTTTGAFVSLGGVGIAGNLNVGENVVITGNLTVQGAVTTLNTATLDVEDLNITVAKGAGSAAAANGAGLTVDGANATFTYASADDSWNVNKLLKGTSLQLSAGATLSGTLTARDINSTVIGNTSPAAATFTTLTTQGTTQLSLTTATAINNTPIGNATPSTGAFTTLNTSGTTQLSLTTATAINNTPIGNATPSTGAFTTLAASGITQITNSTASTTTGNGALVVTGGTGIGGNLNVGGLLNVSSDATVTGDLAVNGGDLTTTQTTFNLVNATATTLNVGGAATALTLGATSGTASLRNANIWLPNATTLDGAQTSVNLFTQNATTANLLTAATTLTVGATTGTITLRNATTSVTGNATVGGTLGVTGNTTLTGDLAVNGGDITTSQTTFNLVNATATTLNVGGAATALNLGATTGTTTVKNNLDVDLSLNARDLQSTVIGNVSPAAATFTTLTSQGTTQLSLTSATAINNTPIGNATPSTGAFTTLTSSGTTQLSLTTATAINNTPIGNATASSGRFTTLVSTSTANLGALTAASINGTVIGNVTPTSGDFTRLAATGIVYANSTVASTNYTNGALEVAGGVGVAGNLSIKLGQQLTIGIDHPTANVSFPERQIVAIGNINAAAGMNLRNMSSGNAASTSYIAIADNNVGESNFVSLSIAGSGWNFPGSSVKANDAFINTAGGNLHIGGAGGGKEVTVSTSLAAADIGIRISHDNANVTVERTTLSTSSTTGAFTVRGGAGFGSNIFVANGAVFNENQTSDNFTVKGKNTSTLIHADSNYGAVVIGGSNASPQLGATLKVNSTDSLMIPVGATADRPSNNGNVDVQGMIRFNTSLSTLEYYTGTTWAYAGSDTTFTIITSEQFTGNGLANTYVLSSNTTTSSSVVSINGILQIPTLAYSVSGNQLVFTENPADGDVIDVRILATTQTVGDVSSPNGLNSFSPTNDDGAAIWSGTTTGNRKLRVAATPEGTWAYQNGTRVAYDQTPVTTGIFGLPNVIDSFSANSYTSAKYMVQHVTDNSANVQVMEALLIHNGSDAYVTTYGIVDSNGTTGVLSANIVSGNVRLYYTSTSFDNGNVKVFATYIA